MSNPKIIYSCELDLGKPGTVLGTRYCTHCMNWALNPMIEDFAVAMPLVFKN